MEAKELRIGNYVLQDNEIISGITSNSIHKFDLGLIKLEPIPLTAEWFEKFAFGQTYRRNAKRNCVVWRNKSRSVLCVNRLI
jgi:hypothetical protein